MASRTPSSLLRELELLLGVSEARVIARRYFVTNGFDGALAMLGVMLGFSQAEVVPLSTVFSACLGAAIALMMSGFSSAYISEAAERQSELARLQGAMVTELELSAHARAARFVPWLIAGVNGLAPLLLAGVIIAPLWLALQGVALPLDPLFMAIGVAFALVFLMGIYLGRISGTFWLWSALRTTALAVVTTLLILGLGP